MGIGRRDFLRLFAGTIATLATAPSSAVAIVDDQYINRKLGIAFRKPQGWTFADVKAMGEVKAGQILDLNDPDLARELLKSAEDPVVVFSKAGISPRADRFTPGVTIFLDRFDSWGGFQPSEGFPIDVPPLENAGADIESCGAMLKEFRVTSPPQAVLLSKCDAAEYTASFVFEHENMRPTRVRMRTLTVYQRPAFYTVRMYDSPYAGSDMTFDFTSFVESIKVL